MSSIVLFCAFAGNVFATCVEGVQMRFNSVQVSVPPSAIQTLVVPNSTTIYVDVDGGIKSGGDWDSTSIQIDGFPVQCFNNSGNNDSANGNTWINRVKTFTITSPSVTGIYEVTVTMYSNDNCDGCDIDRELTLGVGLLGQQGPTGPQGEPGENGQDGEDGEQGEPGEDGADGVGCTVLDNSDGTYTLTCGSDSQTVTINNGEDGINCYDLNENGQEDLCDPNALEEFESCESFFAFCNETEDLDEVTASKSGREMKVFSAIKYRNESYYDCSFTEDVNGDETIDVIDCHGSNGSNGSDGGQGLPGRDGSSCSVVDNLDGSYTMSCEDGTNVTWHDGTDGLDGVDGVDGVDGTDGQPGAPGTNNPPCSLVENPDGTSTITCGDLEFVIGETNTGEFTVSNSGRMCGSADALSLLVGAGLAAAAGFMPRGSRRKS